MKTAPCSRWIPAAVLATALAAPAIAAAPVRVVILSGANVHDWKATTPFLERMYNDSGRFKVVEIVNDVTKITDATFANCDVIVSNWTCHPVMTGGPWTPGGKKAFADAINGGKGMVSFHAACSACNDWPEFQQISGLTWKWEHTSHTAYHTFKVVIGGAPHPITEGMADFWITDELYQKMVKITQADFQVHATAFAEPDWHGTGKWEPVLITTGMGKGRGVNSLLGHDVHAMQNTAWQTIMLRSTEWAATGKVTMPIPQNWPANAAAAAIAGVDADAVLKAAADYAHGKAREPLAAVEQLVIDASSRTGEAGVSFRAKLAVRLGESMASCKTAEAKAFFCKQLAMIGTPEQVPIVAPLLADEQTAMMARFALERIPGPAAAKALRNALVPHPLAPATGPPVQAASSAGPSGGAPLQGKLKIGVINSIGDRSDPEAVDALTPLLANADPAIASAAAAALGKIGNEAAAKAIGDAMPKVPTGLQVRFADAYLMCADRLLAQGRCDQAGAMYTLMCLSSSPPLRTAGLRGLVMVYPSQQVAMLTDALAGSDTPMQTMAAHLMLELPGKSGGKLVDEMLSGFRRTLKGGDPIRRGIAIDALLAWPTPDPIPDLLAVARSDPDESRHLAAIQGAVRLCGLATDRSPEQATELIAQVLQAATRPQEKTVLLAELIRWPCVPALELAVTSLRQPELAEDAGETVVRIAAAFADANRDAVKLAMKQVLTACKSPGTLASAQALLLKASKPVNLALGATASSPDDLSIDGSSGPDQAAIDGNADTFWDETDNQKLYRFRVTFKQPAYVSAINLKGHAYRSHSPKDFDILCDDKVVKTVQNAAYRVNTNEIFITLPRTSCTSLELKITGYYGGSPGIRELEIYDISDADAAALAGPAIAPPAFAWRQSSGLLALLDGDHVVWQFNYGKDSPKPYFHPLALTDGTELTWLCPPDHPHHRALWFAWNKLNGIDYWAEAAADQGQIEVTGAKVDPGPNFSARIELDLSYHPAAKPAVLTEERILAVSAPNKDGGYSIDWQSVFTAGPEDDHLKGGTAGGGYAGLSVRLAKDCRYPSLIDSEGRQDGDCGGVTTNTHGQRARWADVSFAPGVGQPAGIAILDHPANLRHPSQWHDIVDAKTPFVYFSPAPLWSEPYTLPAGKTLTLRYRILVHPGRPERESVEAAWKSFAAGKD